MMKDILGILAPGNEWDEDKVITGTAIWKQMMIMFL